MKILYLHVSFWGDDLSFWHSYCGNSVWHEGTASGPFAPQGFLCGGWMDELKEKPVMYMTQGLGHLFPTHGRVSEHPHTYAETPVTEQGPCLPDRPPPRPETQW